MKLYADIVCAIAFSSVFGFAHAIEPVKTGDILNWKNTTFVANGREVVDGAETVQSSSVTVDSATGERVYVYPRGTTRRNKFFAVLQRNGRVLRPDRSFNYLPQNLNAGEKWKHTTYDSNNRCGVIQYDYEATSTEGPEVEIKIKGVPTKLKTLTVIHEGRWISSACGGSGRAYQKYVFSPALYELVHMEWRYFFNDFLTTGSREVVESID